MTWVPEPERWPGVAAWLLKAGEAGIDTETYGQPDGQSPQHRTRVHVWSLGVLTDRQSPRGFRRAVGVVLPRAALESPDIRAALAAIKLWAHNAPHDEHSLANEGLSLEIEDTLQWLRVAVPGRKDYGLKDAEQWALGYPSRPGFLDQVKYMKPVTVVKRHKERACICGRVPCRAKQTSDWLRDDGVWLPHLRVEWKRFTPEQKLVEARYEITELVPGHARWEQWLAYSLADAVRGMELVDWLRNRRQVTPPYPWSRG